MVVISAVLVVEPDQQGVWPAGAVHDPVDNLGGEALAMPDVLRVLLGIAVEVRVHDAESRQRSVTGVGEELLHAVDMLHVPADTEREDIGRELDVFLCLGHSPDRPARGHQVTPGHLPPVPGITPPPALLTGHRMIVGPRDPVLGEQVEDGPSRRVVKQVVQRVVDETVRCSRDEKTPVRKGRTKARAEPVIGQREGPGQPVVERQVTFRPVAHARGRGVSISVRQRVLRARHESVAFTVPALKVASVPAL